MHGWMWIMDREGSKCYEVFTDKLNWNKAQLACEGYGGDLANIESQAEQDAVAGLTTEAAWLGGNDKEKTRDGFGKMDQISTKINIEIGGQIDLLQPKTWIA
eukprot:TRINITY_DN1468_c0_g2_i1.p2 TRINITY_DN1468_c0_g2~~TRINITY_DN1468_c0_g2_i1.p2  ORF type:complete len:102 (-),score=32.19 TRINITY_DN1468_c0_g2_i1:79-384(-)